MRCTTTYDDKVGHYVRNHLCQCFRGKQGQEHVQKVPEGIAKLRGVGDNHSYQQG
jgi:hypothetical protein